MDPFLLSLTPSLKNNSNAATKKETPGTRSSELSLLVMKSVELMLVDSSYALSLRSTNYSVSKKVKLTPSCGSTFSNNSVKLSLVFNFTMLRTRNGARLTLKELTF
jgi:hypothetical protein